MRHLAGERRELLTPYSATDELLARRRDLLLTPLLAALPAALTSTPAAAAGVDPHMTIVRLPDQISWQQLYNFPPGAAEQAPMQEKVSEPGQYFVLIRCIPVS